MNRKEKKCRRTLRRLNSKDVAQTIRWMRFTQHGWRRSSQRSLSPLAVAAALQFGRSVRCGDGHEECWVTRRCIEQAAQLGLDLSQHVGVAVVVTTEGKVITAWRNQDQRARRRRVTRRRGSCRGGMR